MASIAWIPLHGFMSGSKESSGVNLLMVDEFASVLLEDYCDDVGDGKLNTSNTAL